MTKRRRQKFLETNNWTFFHKMLIFLRTKENLGICPAPGIQEPRWPRASKILCTPLWTKYTTRVSIVYRNRKNKLNWCVLSCNTRISWKKSKICKSVFDTRAVTTTVSHWAAPPSMLIKWNFQRCSPLVGAHPWVLYPRPTCVSASVHPDVVKLYR